MSLNETEDERILEFDVVAVQATFLEFDVPPETGFSRVKDLA
jgi:hypothetical protein